jgi:hypothetical protein
MRVSTWALGVRCLGVFSAAAVIAGCGRQAIATTDALPVHRVVVYRNGVAYFERGGHVDRDEVRFKMKPSEVGDFLATLAVMERGGSSVRAAAFPLDAPDEPEGDEAPDPPDDATAGPKKAHDGHAAKPKDALRTVVLSLDGREHDLQVGYVAEAPVWKPSYRVVIHGDAEADLQVWGIVENLSGEDWRNVKLSLVAGAPLAFQAQLGTPVIPERPVLTDQGEVIAAIPHGETSLRQENAAPEKPAPAPPEPEEKDEAAPAQGAPAGNAPRALRREAGKKVASAASSLAPAAAEKSEAPAKQPAAAPPVSPPRSFHSLAAVAVESGATRYDLPLPVTIPDASATMVMLLSRKVPGEALFLFAPDGGVADSANHPFRVARFFNSAGGTLERGPIAVFDEGAFLGQGMIDPLPSGATATVPFALERALAVDQDRKFDELDARLAKIENGQLTVERDQVIQTKYRLRNGLDKAAKLLVKHPRAPGARLFAPPKGTEDNVGTGSALVPTSVAAHATSDLVVEERTNVRQPADWFSPVADNAVKSYIGNPKSDPSLVQKLSAAWVVRGDIVHARDQRNKLQQESNGIAQSTEETRRNLRAIEKNPTAGALRQKLTARLADASAHLDTLNRQIVELDAKLAELGVRFNESVREIKFVASAFLERS